jgi:PBSX family phage terminase large subunit
MTLMGAYIDELTQIPLEFYLMCLSRLSERGAVFLATTNPDHPKHYVKTDIIDNDVLDKQVIKFLIDDNIFLDETYKENLKKEYTGVFFQRFILGEFVRAEGIIFPEFAECADGWIVDKEDLPKLFRSVEVGFDIGGNGSAYAMTCTGQGYDGIQYKLKAEKRQAGDMSMEDIESFVNEFCGDCEEQYGVHIDMINCDHIAVIVNTINDNTKYRAGLCYKPPLEDRVFLYSKLFATKKVKFVKGMCDDLIDEMQNLVFDDKNERPIPLDDGTMQIDTWDSNIYSESGYWNYIEV